MFEIVVSVRKSPRFGFPAGFPAKIVIFVGSCLIGRIKGGSFVAAKRFMGGEVIAKDQRFSVLSMFEPVVDAFVF